MKTRTTYYAKRSNFFVLLAALLFLFSAVARIIYYAGVDGKVGTEVAVFRIVLPLAANLFVIIQLLAEGGKRLFLTRGPIVLIAISEIDIVLKLARFGLPEAITAACVALIVVQTVLYCLTMRGRINNIFPALAAYLAFAAIAATDEVFVLNLQYYFRDFPMYTAADAANYLATVVMMLGFKRMPPWQEGDPYRLKVGDRTDGRRIRTIQPMSRISPYIMTTRVTSSNYIQDSVEISAMERYIRNKRREGYKHFGITHVLLAAYVRTCAELPGLNRFISGHKCYARFHIDANMVVKKDMSVGEPDTAIKVRFEPTDNAVAVYEKFNSKVQDAKDSPDLDSGFDKLEGALNAVPDAILRFICMILRALDYYGALPEGLTWLSPFHGSMFITSMGSLGIPPIYHHLYDFGNVSQFCAFGAKRTEKYTDENGEEHLRKYIDFTWVTDERIVDGFYYAAALKKIKSYLVHPERLDDPVVPVEDIE